jgi:transposase
MPRKYTNIEIHKEIISSLYESGKSRREIATILGLELKQITNFVTRANNKEKKLSAGVELRPKGRPPKGSQDLLKEKDYEINRLKMENKLLRDFHQLAGRG